MQSIQRTYQLFALTMALLMFTTSVSFAVDLHYCGGQLKSFGIFAPAKNCHQIAAQQPTCPHHQKLAAAQGTTLEQLKKDCCSNRLAYVQSDQNLQTQPVERTLNPPLQLFLQAYVATFLQFSPSKKNASKYIFYRPPLLLKDRAVLHQNFLL